MDETPEALARARRDACRLAYARAREEVQQAQVRVSEAKAAYRAAYQSWFDLAKPGKERTEHVLMRAALEAREARLAMRPVLRLKRKPALK